jgi:hypothetical protein
MRDMIFVKGGSYAIGVWQHDTEATAVTLWAKNDDTSATWHVTASYVDGYAELDITGTQTATIGTYSFQINETIPEGYAKYPSGSCPNGDCGYKIYICETIDGGIS